MTDTANRSLEAAFARSKADADAALKAANSLVASLKRYRNAARQSKVRKLNTASKAAHAR
jgi:hypothetical protein